MHFVWFFISPLRNFPHPKTRKVAKILQNECVIERATARLHHRHLPAWCVVVVKARVNPNQRTMTTEKLSRRSLLFVAFALSLVFPRARTPLRGRCSWAFCSTSRSLCRSSFFVRFVVCSFFMLALGSGVCRLCFSRVAFGGSLDDVCSTQTNTHAHHLCSSCLHALYSCFLFVCAVRRWFGVLHVCSGNLWFECVGSILLPPLELCEPAAAGSLSTYWTEPNWLWFTTLNPTTTTTTTADQRH